MILYPTPCINFLYKDLLFGQVGSQMNLECPSAFHFETWLSVSLMIALKVLFKAFPDS